MKHFETGLFLLIFFKHILPITQNYQKMCSHLLYHEFPTMPSHSSYKEGVKEGVCVSQSVVSITVLKPSLLPLIQKGQYLVTPKSSIFKAASSAEQVKLVAVRCGSIARIASARQISHDSAFLAVAAGEVDLHLRTYLRGAFRTLFTLMQNLPILPVEAIWPCLGSYYFYS